MRKLTILLWILFCLALLFIVQAEAHGHQPCLGPPNEPGDWVKQLEDNEATYDSVNELLTWDWTLPDGRKLITFRHITTIVHNEEANGIEVETYPFLYQVYAETGKILEMWVDRGSMINADGRPRGVCEEIEKILP